MRITFTFCLIFCGFVNSIFSQEIPKAELVDEFGKITCEDLIARQDNLVYQLQNEPNSIAYAVIYGNKNNSKEAWRIKAFLDGQTAFRKYDENKLIVVKSKDEDALRVQFWKIPADAEKPDFQEVGWSYDLSTRMKAFRFFTSEYADDVCPIGLRLRDYSNYLKANENFRGHIVIFTNSKNDFLKEKNEFLKVLTNNYKIPAKQLRFFFVNKNIDYSYYEFWLVPPKKIINALRPIFY